MKAVGIRELKSHLSEYVRQVRQGEEIEITDRGAVVAVLSRPRPANEPGNPEAILAGLAQRGEVRSGRPNAENQYPRLSALVPPGTAARLLAAEREED